MLLMTETKNEISTSTESAGSQLSPAACEKSWRAVEYKAPLSSIGANFLQLSPNAPLRSFVVFCGSFAVLCGSFAILCGPLRYLVMPWARTVLRSTFNSKHFSLVFRNMPGRLLARHTVWLKKTMCFYFK